MKKSPLAFMLLMALAFSSQANAQLINAGAAIGASATVNTDIDCSNAPVTQGPENLAWQAACHPRAQGERQPNPEMEARRSDLEAARENVVDVRAEQQAEIEARREETQSMNTELRTSVQAGETDREEAKAQITAQREEAREEGVENREERAEARTEVVSSRQAMVDTRIAQIREKDSGLADIMEDYYGQIMAKVEAVQAKQTALIEAVKSESMTAADAKVEFKAYIEVEKASIQTLMTEMKAAITAYRSAKIDDIDGE